MAIFCGTELEVFFEIEYNIISFQLTLGVMVRNQPLFGLIKMLGTSQRTLKLWGDQSYNYQYTLIMIANQGFF